MNKDFFDIPIPYDEGAERAVLGSLIVYYPESDFILNILKPEDFYEERNRIVYETIIEIINEGHKINAQTIKLYLEKKGKLEEIGGLAYILELIEESLPVDALEPIVKDLKDKAVARGLIELAKKIIVKAKKIKDVNQLIEEAEAEIFRLNEERSVSEYYPISEIIQQVLKIINDLSKKDTIITGIPSGFYDLDKLTTGFHEGDLVIIAARPAMGKTSFALSIIHNVSVIERLPSAFFSLEMSKEQIGMRLLSLESRIPLKSLRSGFLGEKDLERLTEVALDIAKAPIYIDDTASLSILELRAKARRLKREKDIKLIVVDYLQLMRSHRRTENRQQEVAEISRGLKALAKELNIPVIALAQLSRQVEIRADKRPQLADLRESGCLTGDTLVINADTGELVPIKEMVGKTFNTLALDRDLKIRKFRVSKVFYSGRKKVYLLKTKSGREIKASANHPFLKLEGWTRLDQLKIGDKIAVPRNIPLDLKDKKNIKEEEIILLAHLLGDGCVLPKQPIHYTSSDIENIEVVKETANKLFGIKGKIISAKTYLHVYLTSPYKLGRNKKHPIMIWFQRLSIEPVRSYDKRIPNIFFTLTNKKISLFLRHLWSTDGSLTYRYIKNRFNVSIYYATTSKILAYQIQHLLLRFRILSYVKETNQNSYRSIYNVNIYGKTNQEKFLKEIGCFGKRGKNIDKILNILEKKKSNPNDDVLPIEIWNLIKKLKESKNISWRNICNSINVKYCGSTLFKSSLSRERLFRFYKLFKDEYLYNLANSDIFWDEIVEIKELGIEDVYDMTVDEVHNFIANDIIVHNSIEQDADLVMFIHRPEYYKKNPTPEEEGLAEIIIAKQRNGPTGVVKLAFIKDITKFENLAMIEDEGIEVVEEQPQQLEEGLIGENEDLFPEFEEGDESVLGEDTLEEDDIVDL